jgi:hypothetical protein
MVPVHSATVYPNIVPQNDLRLLDALTIKHGPTRLLARFMLEGDKMARGVGLHLRLRHDFDELLFINRKEAARGSWYPLVDAFNPECTELTPENAFWISGTDDSGEIVVTWAARIYNWIGTNLAEQARALWFGRDLGQPCVVTAPAASMISGVTVCGGASWVRPDFRGKHLSRFIPRMGKAYACSRWPIDWSFCYIGRANVEKGLAINYGQKNLSYSVFYPDSPRGEQVLAYTAVDDVYADMADFLSTALEKDGSPVSSDVSSITFEHIETKTSLDGVLHGSISRS